MTELELWIVAGRVDRVLEAARGAKTIADKRYHLDALARALICADPGSVPDSIRNEARALGVDASAIEAASAPPLPHAVPVPLVSREGIGFVRQLHVTFDPAGLADERWLDASARRSVSEALSIAARHSTPGGEIERHFLAAAQPSALEHARIQGASLGAAAVLSAVALWSGRAMRSGIAVTGAVRSDAVLEVGEIAAKVEAVSQSSLRMLIVPASCAELARNASRGRVEIAVAETIEALLALALVPGAPERPDRAVERARAIFALGWRGYRWPFIRDRLAGLAGALPTGRVDLRVEVLARLAAAQRHLGDPEGSLALLQQALELAESEEGKSAVPDLPICIAWQQRAMTERQLCRFSQASRAAQHATSVARRARMRGELIKSLGCVGLIARSRRRVDEAIDAFREALDLGLRHDPGDTARSHAYLIEALGEAGREDEARAHYQAALKEVSALSNADERRARESWVRTSFAAALSVLGRAEEVVQLLDTPAVRESMSDEPLPGLLARRYLGAALCDLGRVERGFELLAASPIAHGYGLEPHLRFLAQLNVLVEARARSRAGAWTPDAAARTTTALGAVPRYELLRAAREQVERSLLRGQPPKLKALEALVSRAARLG